jgi:hypothetical protein
MRQIKSNSKEIGFAEFLNIIHSRFQNGIKTASYNTDGMMKAIYDHVLLGDKYHIVFSYEKRTGSFFTGVLLEDNCVEYYDVATSEQDFTATLIELSRSVNAGDYEC